MGLDVCRCFFDNYNRQHVGSLVVSTSREVRCPALFCNAVRISWTNNKFLHRVHRAWLEVVSFHCANSFLFFDIFDNIGWKWRSYESDENHVKLKPSQNANKFKHTKTLPNFPRSSEMTCSYFFSTRRESTCYI
jgi:hypothetical protein